MQEEGNRKACADSRSSRLEYLLMPLLKIPSSERQGLKSNGLIKVELTPQDTQIMMQRAAWKSEQFTN